MPEFDPDHEPSAWGTYEDAERLRRWAFLRKTPEQRLAWLVEMLEIAYASGAIKPRRPDVSESSPESAEHPSLRTNRPESPESS
jgi:hypothetical protein